MTTIATYMTADEILLYALKIGLIGPDVLAEHYGKSNKEQVIAALELQKMIKRQPAPAQPDMLTFEQALTLYRAGERIAHYNEKGMYGRVFSIHPGDTPITSMHGAFVLHEDWVVVPPKKEKISTGG